MLFRVVRPGFGLGQLIIGTLKVSYQEKVQIKQNVQRYIMFRPIANSTNVLAILH